MQRKGAAGLKRWHVGRVPAGWPQPAPKEMMQPCLVHPHIIYLVARTSPHRAMRLLAISWHQRDDATLSSLPTCHLFGCAHITSPHITSPHHTVRCRCSRGGGGGGRGRGGSGGPKAAEGPEHAAEEGTFADTPSASLLRRLLKGERGAAEEGRGNEEMLSPAPSIYLHAVSD